MFILDTVCFRFLSIPPVVEYSERLHADIRSTTAKCRPVYLYATNKCYRNCL